MQLATLIESGLLRVIMQDLSIFDTVTQSNAGAKLHLLVPSTKMPAYADAKETLPLTISLLGADSDLYSKEIQKKARELRRKKNNSNDLDLDKSIREACELYARLTVSFENIPSGEKGKYIEGTYQNAFDVYLKHKDIRVQVGDFISDQSNFIVG